MNETAHLGPHMVRRVGFGAMQLPGPGVYGPPRDRDQALAVLRRAREAGVDHIDTASYYGPDVSNELIHEARRVQGMAPGDLARGHPVPGRGRPAGAGRRAIGDGQPAPVRARRAHLRGRPGHAPHILLIPGTSSLAHLEENLAAGELELGEDDLRALDALA